MNPTWFQVTSTLVSLAIGVGMAWGIMSKTVARLENKVDELDKLCDTLRVEMAEMKGVIKACKHATKSE